MIAGGVAVRPDLAFPRLKIAVFVDGCFWHGCPAHGTAPKTNAEYWAPKLQRNRARDRLVSAALGDAGWVVIRIWEHEDPASAAALVREAVRERAASA
jgi:DNA mismatch endonuclease (patch repair protein)